MITIDEIMSRDVETLTTQDSLATASELMSQRGIRHLPIVDAQGKLAGLVTQSDLLSASASRLAGDAPKRLPADICIAEFMTRNVATVDERAGLRQAAMYLQRHKYGCLPVVTDGELRGIVTDFDFVTVAVNLLEQMELEEPDDY